MLAVAAILYRCARDSQTLACTLTTHIHMFFGMYNLQDVAADDGGGFLPWHFPVPPCSLLPAVLQGLCSDGLH